MFIRKNKRLAYYCYLVLMISLIFIGIECSLNYIIKHPEQQSSQTREILQEYYYSDVKIIQYQRHCAKYDKELFYTLKPGKFVFENLEFSNEFRVNSIGCRDDESSLQNPQIICIGDSYTMGWGVEQNETFPQLIERKLGKKVLNMGISSYGTPREIAFLERTQTDSMKYLIIQYCDNDNHEIKEFIKHDNTLKTSTEIVYDSLVSSFDNRTGYYPFKYTLTLLPKLIKREKSTYAPNDQNKKKTSSEKAVNLYRGFIDVIKQSKKIQPNVKIIVFNLSEIGFNNHFLTIAETQLNREFGSRWHDQISFLDFSEKLTSHDYYKLDGHINQKGHKKVAKTLIKEITKKDTVTEKKWHHKNGAIAITAQYKNGLKNGPCLYYWPNGALSRQAHFKDAWPVGQVIDFNDQGDTLSIKQAIK